MELAAELALTCVTCQVKRAAEPELSDIRSRFESSAARERLLRRHAERWNQLAQERAEAEDTSLGGYAGTALQRSIPVPHTTGEAVTRLGGIGAGGLAGYLYGRGLEGMDPAEAKRIFSPVGGRGPGKGTPIQEQLQRLHERLRAEGKVVGDPTNVLNRLRTASGAEIAEALGERAMPTSIPKSLDEVKNLIKNRGYTEPSSALRSELEGAFGKGSIGSIREEVRNVAQQTARKPGMLAEILPGFSRKGLKGALIGGAGMAALTGIPFVLKALYDKMYGGEAAVRARGRAQQVLGEAEGLSGEREKLLRQLPKPEAVA